MQGPPRANPEGVSRGAMVKRCGKSAPRPWQHGWQAKPRTEQGQIGEHGGRDVLRSVPVPQWTARPQLPGRLLDPASDGGARGMIVTLRSLLSCAARRALADEGGDRIRLTAGCGGLSRIHDSPVSAVELCTLIA